MEDIAGLTYAAQGFDAKGEDWTGDEWRDRN